MGGSGCPLRIQGHAGRADGKGVARVIGGSAGRGLGVPASKRVPRLREAANGGPRAIRHGIGWRDATRVPVATIAHGMRTDHRHHIKSLTAC